MTVGIVLSGKGTARAEKEDARKHYDRATAAFGLGRYADAAVEYEAAFRLRPDPALLYNCAQSYRLGGNKPRALELYRNYLRLYGDAPNADDAHKHVADLEREIEATRVVPAPVPAAPPPAVALAAPAPAPVDAAAAPSLTTTAETAAAGDREQRSLLRSPWFWGAVGAVVVAGTVAVIIAASGEQDPKASLSVVLGN